MAASIPVLRTLFRDLRVSSRRRSNDHHAASSRIAAIAIATATAGGAGASKASSGSRSTGSSSSAPGYDDDDDDDDYDFDGSEEDGHELAERGADSRSDECIIGDAEKAMRIVRSTVVEVRYHAADGEGDPPRGATCGTGDGSK